MGKLAIVTGGSTGIGAHLVQALVGAGYRVGFTYLQSPDAAQSVAASYGGAALAVRCDAGDADEVRRRP